MKAITAGNALAATMLGTATHAAAPQWPVRLLCDSIAPTYEGYATGNVIMNHQRGDKTVVVLNPAEMPSLRVTDQAYSWRYESGDMAGGDRHQFMTIDYSVDRYTGRYLVSALATQSFTGRPTASAAGTYEGMCTPAPASPVL